MERKGLQPLRRALGCQLEKVRSCKLAFLGPNRAIFQLAAQKTWFSNFFSARGARRKTWIGDAT